MADQHRLLTEANGFVVGVYDDGVLIYLYTGTPGQQVSILDRWVFPSYFPETPQTAPTTNYQMANKKYVDDSIAAIPPPVTTSTDYATAFMLMGG